jgi:hypothetical protein
LGSSTHTQGSPQRPGLTTQRDFRAVLAHNQERTADNRYAIYLRPIGRDMHLVRNECNEQPYVVNSLTPGATFSPNSMVMLVSNSGHPGEAIVGGPPLGRKGASLVASVPALRVSTLTAEEPTDPPPVLSATILGFYGDSGTNTLYCFEYDEVGAYVADVCSAVMVAGVPVTSIKTHQRIVHDSAGSGLGTPLLMYNTNTSAGGTSGTRAIVVWDLYANAVTVITPTMPGGAANWGVGCPFVPPGEANGYLYFFAHDDGTANGGNLRTHLWRAKMDGSDTPAIIADAGTDTNGTAHSSALFDETYGYNLSLASAIQRYPLAGGVMDSITASASAVSSTAIYWAGGVSGTLAYMVGVSGRRQRRIVYDSGVTNKWIGSNAFSLDAPNTSTTDRHITVNRTLDTSGYFHWNSGTPKNTLKFGQPAGDTSASGHGASAPNISLAVHPTLSQYPDFAHLVDFSYPW